MFEKSRTGPGHSTPIHSKFFACFLAPSDKKKLGELEPELEHWDPMPLPVFYYYSDDEEDSMLMVLE